LEILEKTNYFQKYISKNSLFLLYLEIVLLKYLILKQCDTIKTYSECLPDSSGPLAITMPSGFITATNLSVAKVLESSRNKMKPKGQVVNTKYSYTYYVIRIYTYVAGDISWQASNSNILLGYFNCVYIVYVH